MVPYGCESFGRLTHVLLHVLSTAQLSLITEATRRHYLFDSVPDAAAYTEEQERYADLLRSLGVKVLRLSDYVVEHRDLMRRLPNLAYLHDIAVVHSRGAIVSRMAWPGRAGEETVVREALGRLGVPVLYDSGGIGAFEGCLLLRPGT
ncbi:MAG: arginine deiminase, partial [Pseudomonadota bacterium]